MKFLSMLSFAKAWLLLSKILVWILATAGLIVAADRPFEFERPDAPRPDNERSVANERRPYVPPMPELPIPELPPEAATHDAPSVEPNDSRSASTDSRLTDSRPTVYFYEADDPRTCIACQQFWAAVERGELPEWNFVKRPRPPWATIVPTLHFQRPDGSWWNYPRSAGEWAGIAGFRESYRQQCGKLPQPTSYSTELPGAGASLPEQFQRFAGSGGIFAFTPDRPIRATLDDGTVIQYRELRGRYSIVGGKPTLVLDPPLPVVTARKWFLSIGAQVSGAEYTEDPRPTVTIDTSRGKYRVVLEQAR